MGAKVILASRNLQQLERLKFQLDSEPANKVHSQQIFTSSYELPIRLLCCAGVCQCCEVLTKSAAA